MRRATLESEFENIYYPEQIFSIGFCISLFKNKSEKTLLAISVNRISLQNLFHSHHSQDIFTYPRRSYLNIYACIGLRVYTESKM